MTWTHNHKQFISCLNFEHYSKYIYQHNILLQESYDLVLHLWLYVHYPSCVLHVLPLYQVYLASEKNSSE